MRISRFYYSFGYSLKTKIAIWNVLVFFSRDALEWKLRPFSVAVKHKWSNSYVQSVLTLNTLPQFCRPHWSDEMPVAFWLLWQNGTTVIYSNLGGCWLHASVVPFHWVFSPKLWEVYQFQTSIKMNVLLIDKFIMEIEKDNYKKKKEKALFEQFDLYSFPQLCFSGLITTLN